MKCPRCGHEMYMDDHRKMDMYMCYDCGYIENRRIDFEPDAGATNFERLSSMNLNEAVAFISKGLGLEEKSIAKWMEKAYVRA